MKQENKRAMPKWTHPYNSSGWFLGANQSELGSSNARSLYPGSASDLYSQNPYMDLLWNQSRMPNYEKVCSLQTWKESLFPTSLPYQNTPSKIYSASPMPSFSYSTPVSTILLLGAFPGDTLGATNGSSAREILSKLWFLTPRARQTEVPALPPPEERGQSTMKLSSGAMYSGEVLLGAPDGVGKLVDLTSGRLIYDGEWREGKFHGRGTRFAGDIELESGDFEAGEFVSGRRVMEDGSLQIGTFAGKRLEGEGRVVFPSLAVVSGVWREGKPVGSMQYSLPGGFRFEYDEAKADPNSKFEVQLTESFIYFHTSELEGRPLDFLFYSNGDIFVGETGMQSEPLKGLFFHLYKKGYCRMEMDGGLEDMQIHDIRVLLNAKNKLQQVLFC